MECGSYSPRFGRQDLNRGINLGGWFSHFSRSAESLEAHVRHFLTPSDIKRIRDLGFDHVRLTVDHRSVNSHSAMSLLEWAILQILEAGLGIQLNMHFGPGLEFLPGAVEHPYFSEPALRSEHEALWRRWLDRFGHLQGVWFEFLNEPASASSEALNEAQARLVRELRSHTDAPFVLTTNAYSTPKMFERVLPPPDPNLVYAFHFYSPLLFTHQQAPWVTWTDVSKTYTYPGWLDSEPSLICGSSEIGFWDAARIEAVLKPVLEFRDRTGIPVICNEWGVFESVPRVSALKWVRDYSTLLHRYRIGSTYWNFRGCGFGVDRDEELLEALLEKPSASL